LVESDAVTRGVTVVRTAAQHPNLRPQSSALATAAANRIMHRLSTGISLLSNPAQLETQLQAIAAENTPANQNPQIYRVTLVAIFADEDMFSSLFVCLFVCLFVLSV